MLWESDIIQIVGGKWCRIIDTSITQASLAIALSPSTSHQSDDWARKGSGLESRSNSILRRKRHVKQYIIIQTCSIPSVLLFHKKVRWSFQARPNVLKMQAVTPTILLQQSRNLAFETKKVQNGSFFILKGSQVPRSGTECYNAPKSILSHRRRLSTAIRSITRKEIWVGWQVCCPCWFTSWIYLQSQLITLSRDLVQLRISPIQR